MIIRYLWNVIKKSALYFASSQSYFSKTPVSRVWRFRLTIQIKIILSHRLFSYFFLRRFRIMNSLETINLWILIECQISQKHKIVLGPIFTVLHHLEPGCIFRIRIVVSRSNFPELSLILLLFRVYFLLTFWSRLAFCCRQNRYTLRVKWQLPNMDATLELFTFFRNF